MDKFNYYKDVLRNYAKFDGRARRSEYWYFMLFNFIISIILGLIDIEISSGLLRGIYTLAVIVPSIAVQIRRIHDVGKSGWFILIPLYNFYLTFLDSEPGSNEYGPNPKHDELNLEDNLIK